VIEQEMTMIKTISAALLAVSMLAAPAMAAGPSHAVTPAKSAAVGGSHVGAKVLNAQARMHKHRVVHHRHLRKHRAHKPVVMHRGHRH
jgi:hypothetical protein